MNNRFENPFSITKAVSFSDDEINKFWVELIENRKTILNPFDDKPKYILGSKGCGKTHLMRYFSLSARQLFYQNDLLAQLRNDGYIGLYMLLGGLNCYRFEGENISLDIWKTVFQQYFEIFIIQDYLQFLSNLINLGIITFDEELEFVKKIKLIFKSKNDLNFVNVIDLVGFLDNIQRNSDFEVNNCSITQQRSLNIEIIANPGDIIFGIPQLAQVQFKVLADIKIVFLLDELEKLSEYQKEFINTLVWENKNPCRIWIGARYYGFKTKKTFNGEELKEGSEYEELPLDEIHRSDEKVYREKCLELVVKRLKMTGYIDQTSTNQFILDNFEKFNEMEIIERIIRNNGSNNFPHQINLIEKLKKIDLPEREIGEIIINLSCKENPLYEKYNYFLFYQDWYSSKVMDLITISQEIRKEFDNFISSGESKRHINVIDKFKFDLLAQLLVETNNQYLLYSNGFDTLVRMSWGNPRSLLIILKSIFKWTIYNNKEPFKSDIISIEEQYKGIREGSQWYYNDAELKGEDGKFAYNLIENIGRILNAERYSDKPIECSPSSIYFNRLDISDKASYYIQLVIDHSFLVEVEKGRIDRNIAYSDQLLQLHRMLAPKWFLPIARRGSNKLSTELVESIFSPDMKSRFKSQFKIFLQKRTAPFKNYKITNSLFD